jgi:hypothetical protein
MFAPFGGAVQSEGHFSTQVEGDPHYPHFEPHPSRVDLSIAAAAVGKKGNFYDKTVYPFGSGLKPRCLS